MECINENCGNEERGQCTHKIISNTCVSCDKRIKPTHTQTYAEEQLEHVKNKENRCYDKKCAANESNICTAFSPFGCKSRIKEAINYEEEYNKLKSENGTLQGQLQYANNLNRLLLKEKEELTKRNNTQYESIENMLKDIEEYSNKIIKLEQENKHYEHANITLGDFRQKLEGDIKTLKDRINNYQDSILEKQTKIEELEENDSEFKEYINKLRKSECKLREEITKLKETVIKLAKRL